MDRDKKLAYAREYNRRTRAEQREQVPCCVCGETFSRFSYKKNAICSPKCVGEFNRLRYHHGNTCGRCGTSITTGINHCRSCVPRAAAERRLARAAEGSHGGATWITGPCVICRKQFTSRQPGAMVCSHRCRISRAGWSFRRNHGSGTHRSRARRFGVAYEPINPKLIFERDDWRCGICGEPVDRDAKCPEPLSPSLDHIMPMARGGPHLAVNVQCAHFECNWRKGDSLATTEGGEAW